MEMPLPAPRAGDVRAVHVDRGRDASRAATSSSSSRTRHLRSAVPTVVFDLPEEHEALRETVRDFAEREIAPVAGELDRTKAFPYEIVGKLGELGWMGIPFPEEYGGAGADTLAYAVAVEELARVDSSVAITLCAHTSLGTQPIYLFGTEEQKQEWLPRLTSGERLAAFGLTEPEAGSDAGNTRTRARLDGRRVGDRRRQAVHHERRHRHLRGSSRSPPSPARRRQPRDLEPDRPERHARLRGRGAVPRRWAGTPPTRARSRSADCRVPEANLLGERGAGPAAVPRGARHRPDRRRRDGGRPRAGRVRPGARVRATSAQAFGRPIARFQAIAGGSPTCPPRSRRRGC